MVLHPIVGITPKVVDKVGIAPMIVVNLKVGIAPMMMSI